MILSMWYIGYMGINKMKQLKRYLPLIAIGGIVYMVMQKYVFAGDKTKKDKLNEYYKKMFGDKEKQIQQESPEKLMFNIRE